MTHKQRILVCLRRDMQPKRLIYSAKNNGYELAAVFVIIFAGAVAILVLPFYAIRLLATPVSQALHAVHAAIFQREFVERLFAQRREAREENP